MAGEPQNSAPAPMPQAGGAQPPASTGASASPQQGGGEASIDPRVIQQLMAQLKTRQSLAQPPMRASFKEPGMMKQMGMNLLSQFVPFVGNAVQQSVNRKKQEQVDEAMMMFKGLHDDYEMAWAMTANIPDFKARQAKAEEIWGQMPSRVRLGSDKKSQKMLAKAFVVDFTNPEKTQNNVAHQGLQKFLKVQPHSQVIKTLAGRMGQQSQGQPQQGGQGGGQPAGQPQQPQNRGDQMAAQMPRNLVTPTPQTLEHVGNTIEKVANFNRLNRDRYDFKTDQNNKWFAFDKTNPTAPPVPIQTTDGEQIGAKPMASEGKVATVATKPYGVTHNGQVLTPKDKEWTPVLQSKLDEANIAWAQAQVAQDKRASARAIAYNMYRQYPVISKVTGDMEYVSGTDLISHPGQFAPASTGMQGMGREAIFTDMNYNVGNVGEALSGLKKGFDGKFRAQLILALRSDDPAHMTQTFLSSLSRGAMSDDQQNLVIAIAALQENAMLLRQFGAGQGSDMVRRAIEKMLPGPGSPDIRYAHKQLEFLKNTIDRLHTGVPIVRTGDTTPRGTTRVIDLTK